MNPNEDRTLYKDIWITTAYNAGMWHDFIFQKEYFIDENTSLVILISQREYLKFIIPEDPEFTFDVHPVSFTDYRVYIWEEIDSGIREFNGFVNVYKNSFITDVYRCQTARANLKNSLHPDSNYATYEIDLRILIDEPLELDSTTNIVF